MELFGKIHAAGNTVILVTHEEDIAKYAHRVVRLRDGNVETDTLNLHHI
jgi:putative ABC transport system ATP-binding protein